MSNKNHFHLLFFLWLPFISFSQDRIMDLVILNDIIKKTPSYKSQIRGHKKNEYNKLYNELKLKINERNNDLQHFELLSQLVGKINDNHFVLQYIPDTSFDWKRYSDKSYVSQFLKRDYLINHPKVRFNSDSLELSLKLRQINEVEGVYYFQSSSLKIGVYRITGSTFNGIILE